MRRAGSVLVVLLPVLSVACPRSRQVPAVTVASIGETAVAYEAVEAVSRLPDDPTLFDADCGCRVDVPPGWERWQVHTDESMIVRLQRSSPVPFRIEITRGTGRVPEGGEQFFDRGHYLAGDREGETVAVWSRAEPDQPGVRYMGVLLEKGDRDVVVEGWIPEEEFEASKRAFDAVVMATTFVE